MHHAIRGFLFVKKHIAKLNYIFKLKIFNHFLVCLKILNYFCSRNKDNNHF